MHISFDISPVILIFSAISLLFSAILIFWEYINIYFLKKSIKESEQLKSLNQERLKAKIDGVSVIVYCDNDLKNLTQNLPAIINQDYPEFEIIIVNDGKNEAINDFINRMSIEYSNLHYSYTPDDARNLSRKKLALMIGIKAAKYDIIITTNSHCKPQSNHWISAIARHFLTETDVVIGYSRIADDCDTQKGHSFRYFSTLHDTIQYLVQAICRKPYRGTSDNLAYRKDVFFKNKGFSRSMHLHHGEDDIFVNEIATHNNTKTEITPESLVISHIDNAAHSFLTLKLQRMFTERMFHSSAFALGNLKTIIFYINFILLCGIAIADFSNIIVIAIPCLISIIFTPLQIILHRKTADLLSYRKLSFSIPIYTFILPISNLYYKLKSRRHTSFNYTWQPLKKRI